MADDSVLETQRVRAARPGGPGRGTRSVPDVRRSVEDAVIGAFPTRTWVTGQVGRTSVDVVGGALRFTLHSDGEDADPFGLHCVVSTEALPDVRDVLDRVHDADVSSVVWEGRRARAGGLLRYDADRNGITLNVTDLDPAVTAQGLEQERAQVLERVRAGELTARQSRRPVPSAPLCVALVRETGDPAGEAVLERLQGSSYAVVVQDCPGTLHGPTAGAQLGQRVREAALLSEAVLVVRGAGRPLALGVYDGDEVARAIADAPVPVVCGLGGGGLRTAADEVAYASTATAADAAGWVLGRLEESERSLRELEQAVHAAAAAAGTRAWDELEEVGVATAVAADEAQARAERAERRRWVRLQVGALVVVALVVGLALGTGSVLALSGLLLPVLVLAGVWAWSRQARARGSRSMVSQDDEFAEVVERLRGVRDSLEGTSSPEQVHRLRTLSGQLVERGEDILLRHFPDHEQPRSVRVTVEPPQAPAPPPEPASPPSSPEPSNVRTVALAPDQRVSDPAAAGG